MRRFVLSWIIAWCCCLEMVARTAELRIMTYNVPRNNEYIGNTGVNTLERRYAALAEYVNKIHPDVLGMQEPTNADLWMYLKNIKGYAMIGVGRIDGLESGQYTLILYRTDKYYIEKEGIYFLSKTPDVMGSSDWGSQCSRLATWAIFRDKATQTRFLYTNTHLDHVSDSARTNQMRVIKEHMRDIIAENGEMPMMITGDFNVYRNTEGAYINATTLHIPMNEAWLVAKEQKGLYYSFPSFAHKYPRRLDYIMLSKDITVETAYTGNSLCPSGTNISDHNPHWADITWETTSDEDARALLNDAKIAYDSTLTYVSTGKKLITDADEESSGCQLSYDTKQENEGALINLIDGSTSTIFRSSWSTTNPYQPHYFQVDLRQPYQNVHFDYARMAGTSSTAVGNCIIDLMVTASNDGTNWDYVTEFCNISTRDGLQTLPTINMRQPYRYMRFSAMRTPDMKIRTSHVQYVLSEFQLYEDVIDTLKSQRYTNPEVKAACDALQPLLTAAQEAYQDGTLTEAQINTLRQALQQLRSVKMDKTVLQNLLSEATTQMNTFKSGSKFGNGTSVKYLTLKSAVTKYTKQIGQMSSMAEVTTAYTTLQGALEDYLASRKTFETNKWYYIQCRHVSLSGSKDAMFGQALYAGGNGSGVLLKNGLYQSSQMTEPQNPYAMWRILETEGGYAIQNRATGFYLGGLNSDNVSYNISATPVAYNIDMKGVEDFHFSLVYNDDIFMTANNSNYFLTAMADSTIAPSQDGYHSAAAWIFNEVDDKAIGSIKMPLTNHKAAIMTLPYAYENMNTSDGIHTYTIAGVAATYSFALKEKNSFQAGEPFVIVPGKVEELDINCTDTTYIDVTPPNDFASTPVSINGMYGLFDNTTPTKNACYIQDNRIKLGKPLLPALSGYIIKADVENLYYPFDMVVSYSQGVLGIESPIITTDEKTDVYTVDGQCLYRNVTVNDIRNTLKKGIYIIGKKKVIIN